MYFIHKMFLFTKLGVYLKAITFSDNIIFKLYQQIQNSITFLNIYETFSHMFIV